MEKTIYLTNPCKASGLPYWKSNLIKIPENMKAEFVTVSGKIDNPTNPRDLYLACGFSGEEIWHVMRK